MAHEQPTAAQAALANSIEHWARTQRRASVVSSEPIYQKTQRMEVFVVVTAVIACSLWVGCAAVGMALWPEGNTLQSPFGEAIEGRSAALTNLLSGLGFHRYVTCVLWLVVVSTGLLMEAVLGRYVVETVSQRAGQVLWQGAQLLFSLFISVALFSASAFGLPFAAFGLWKGGFPETIACFQEAFVECAERRLTLAAVATHLCPLNRSLLALSLPLVIQHIVVLLR